LVPLPVYSPTGRQCAPSIARFVHRLSLFRSLNVGATLTEIPEHLLKRSRDAKRAAGLDVPPEAGAPAEAPTQSANAPAVVGSATPAAGAPVPIPASEPPPPEPPTSAWVASAEGRKKVPYWVMPVLLFLPIWLIMYVGTLEEPTRSEGVLFEGGEVYAEHCASCHGAEGQGSGAFPGFQNGAVIETFSLLESQIAWVVHGTQGYDDAGIATYGDTNKAVGGSGANMPAFGDALTTEELVYAVLYERVALSGYTEELELAERLFDKLDHGELELGEHFVEGVDGDFENEIVDMFDEVRQELIAIEGDLASGAGAGS